MSKPTARIDRMLSVRLQNTARSGGHGSAGWLGMSAVLPAYGVPVAGIGAAQSPASAPSGGRLLPTMWRRAALLRCGACVAGLLSLGACGAGLITGIAAGNRGGGSPEARVPELSVQPLMPLVPPPNTTRTAVVANAQIAAAARIVVRIDA